MTDETLSERVWRQVAHGLDVERLLPTRQQRARALQKKLDRPPEKNGYRMFAAGCAHTVLNGRAKPARNAEAALVRAATEWAAQVADLLPERAADLQRLVELGIANPAPTPNRNGGSS